jgi:hypothetical protein
MSEFGEVTTNEKQEILEGRELLDATFNSLTQKLEALPTSSTPLGEAAMAGAFSKFLGGGHSLDAVPGLPPKATALKVVHSLRALLKNIEDTRGFPQKNSSFSGGELELVKAVPTEMGSGDDPKLRIECLTSEDGLGVFFIDQTGIRKKVLDQQGVDTGKLTEPLSEKDVVQLLQILAKEELPQQLAPGSLDPYEGVTIE